jgi:hypothetical protein
VNFLSDIWTGATAKVRVGACIVLLLLAAGIRIRAASDAYPVPGDGGHFVQYGLELAHGNPEGMSTYWSQAMIALACFAVKLGWEPAAFLRGVCVAAGSMVPLLALFLAHACFRRWQVGLVAGLLLAANPAAVHYSITGYSEMPFVALALGGALVVVQAAPWKALIGYALFGAAAYFKGTDASLVAAAAAAWQFLVGTPGGIARRIGYSAAGLAVFMAVILPLCLFTLDRSGAFAPGNKGLNLAFGDAWSDSKAVYAVEKPWEERQRYLEEQGTLAFMIAYRGELAARGARNTAQAIRLVNDQFFAGPLRVGPIWFVALFLVGALLAWREHRLGTWLFPLLIAAVPTALIVLCLVHDRLLFWATVCLALVLADTAVMLGQALCRDKWTALAGVMVLALFTVKSAQLATHAWEREWFHWRYAHMHEAGIRARSFGSEEDVLMAQGPHMALAFYRERPMRTVELPYGTIDDVAQAAANQSATIIVVSDQARPHWPITGLFRGEPAPAEWRLLDELRFPGDEDRGRPEEKYRIYRRSTEAVH